MWWPNKDRVNPSDAHQLLPQKEEQPQQDEEVAIQNVIHLNSIIEFK